MPRHQRWLAAFIGWLGAALMHLWIGSLRLRQSSQMATANPLHPNCAGNYLFAVWHDVLLAPTYLCRVCRQYSLISQSKDGEYIARIITTLGWQVVRGSSSRGAVTAVRKLLKLATNRQRFHLVITADGPRGPRHILKEGVVFLAAKTGMPVIPVGVAYDRPWRANSWDRFALPRPFSRAHIFFGAPIEVPPLNSAEELEAFRARVEEEVNRAEVRAHEILTGTATPNTTVPPAIPRAA